jgi:hypothetical protein
MGASSVREMTMGLKESETKEKSGRENESKSDTKKC